MRSLVSIVGLAVVLTGCAANRPASLEQQQRDRVTRWTGYVRRFYHTNVDLVGRERCVDRVLKDRYGELKAMPVDDGFTALGGLARDACVPGANWTRVVSGDGAAYIDFSRLERTGATVVYWARWEGGTSTVDYRVTREIANCATRMSAQLHFSAYEAGRPTVVSNEPQAWKSAPPGSILEGVLRAACAGGSRAGDVAKRKPAPPRVREAATGPKSLGI